MHTLTKFSLSLLPYYCINMDAINNALYALILQDKPNISVATKLYNVDRSTLSKRFRRVTILR